MAINKSTSNKWLLAHTRRYSLVLSILLIPLYTLHALPILTNIANAWLFMLITFCCHTVTDYITSRMVKKRFDKKDFHNGFVVIGADQILHYIQILLTLSLFM